MSLSFGAVPPVEASYTARRAHAARNERRDENNPALCMQPPPTSRWRASFSASGNLLTFGSRSVELIDLSKFDRTRDPEDPSPRERMERSLKVHVDHNSRREPLQLHTLLRDYKVAVVGTDQEAPQHALAEQHVWKLVAALFLPVGKDLVPTEGLSLGRDEGKDKSTEATRRLEALRAWLRAAQWDAGAIERCKRDEAIEQDSEAASVWPLLKAADPAEACKAALDDGRAYLGALLAQPTGCVRADLEAQLRSWEGEPPEMVPEPLKRYFGLLAGTVSSWNEGPGKVSSWMHSYTLELLEEQRPPGWPHSYAPAPPAPPADANGAPPKTMGAAWHLLRLTATGGAHADQPLGPLPMGPPTRPETRGARKNAGGSGAQTALRLGDFSFAWHLERVVAPLLGVRGGSPRLHDAFAHQLELSWQSFVDAHLRGARFDHALGCRWVEVDTRLPPPSGRRLSSDSLSAELAKHRPPEMRTAPQFSCDDLEAILRDEVRISETVNGVECERQWSMRLDELRPDDYVRDARDTCWVPAPDGRLLDLLARQALPDEPSPRVLALLELDRGRGAPLPPMASQLLYGFQDDAPPGLQGASLRALLAAHRLAAVRARSAGHHALTAKHFLAIVRLGGATAFDLHLRRDAWGEALARDAWGEALCAVETLLPAALLTALLTDDGPDGDVDLRALLDALERTRREFDAKQRWHASSAAAAWARIPGPVVDGGAPKRRAQGATVDGGPSYAPAAAQAIKAAAEEELRYGRWSEHTLAALAAYAS